MLQNTAARLMHSLPPDVPGAAVTAASSANEPNALLYLLGGGSVVTILGMLLQAAKGWKSGKYRETIRRERGLVAQLDSAWRERDSERDKRLRAERNLFRVESHAGNLTYLLNKHGVPAAEIPAYPQLENDPEPPAPAPSNTDK